LRNDWAPGALPIDRRSLCERECGLDGAHGRIVRRPIGIVHVLMAGETTETD
jgi:hypothetical protein